MRRQRHVLSQTGTSIRSASCGRRKLDHQGVIDIIAARSRNMAATGEGVPPGAIGRRSDLESQLALAAELAVSEEHVRRLGAWPDVVECPIDVWVWWQSRRRRRLWPSTTSKTNPARAYRAWSTSTTGGCTNRPAGATAAGSAAATSPGLADPDWLSPSRSPPPPDPDTPTIAGPWRGQPTADSRR